MENEQTSDETQADRERREEHSSGSKSADNPEIGSGTGEGDGGLGTHSGALGGEHPVEPEKPAGERTPPDQLHPHGESGR